MTLALDLPDCSQSPIGRMDCRWKLASLIPAALLVAFLQSPPTLWLALLGALLLAALARLPPRWCGLRLAGLALFLGLFVVWLPFFPAQDEEALDFLGLSLSAAGLRLAGVILAKGLSLVSLMLVMLATAPLPDTLKAAHALRVPSLVIHLALLTYRHVFLLADEFVRLRTALRVRGFRSRATLHSYRTVGQVAGTLLVRGHDRAERVGQAMTCRGFDGHYRSLCEFRTRPSDVVAFVLVLGAAIGLLVWDLALR